MTTSKYNEPGADSEVGTERFNGTPSTSKVREARQVLEALEALEVLDVLHVLSR